MIETSGLERLVGWQPKSVRLRYSLSYVKLFELKFNGLDDPRPFNPDTPPEPDIRPPVDLIPPDYDVIVERNRPLATEIAVIQRLPNMLRYAPRQMPHFYTDLRGGPEKAFRSMSAKTRSTLTRKVRAYKAFCGGEIRWSIYKTPGQMLDYHRLAREVARKTYQERLFNSGLPDTEEFRASMIELAKRDQVRGFLLFHGDKPVAYLYTPAPDGFLVYEYLGYDPEYAERSPGTVLHYLALEALYAERRFPLYYWSYGRSQTKEIFSTGQVLGADIYYFRPTLPNRLAVWLHFVVDRFSTLAGVLLERVHVKQFIKRWLKRQ